MIPQLIEFNPDFILISAGFDAHEKDHIHMDTDTTINEFDYKWVTQQLVKVANQCCDGRLVSILEGGYSTKSGPISPLAQSVSAHVQALLRTNSSSLIDPEKAENALICSDIQPTFPNIDSYLSWCKQERGLLKKRRADFALDANPFTFMKMSLRPKRQKLDEKS